MEDKKIHALYVCTGNVFRSLSAERFARAYATPNIWEFQSAGLRGRSDKQVHPETIRSLKGFGINPDDHVSKPLTPELIRWADIVIAMDQTHQYDIIKQYKRRAPLYDDICGEPSLGILDLPDIFEDGANHSNLDDIRQFIDDTIAGLNAITPSFLERLKLYVPGEKQHLLTTTHSAPQLAPTL